ncbi:uncharacterized protein EAE97_006292 [Botrytis byssoidea]|uniref:DUF1996 domain-containing protein n=1 Tax=Botrytis byssoidea TaxID=139641 RepID=A0A9P5IIY1_9HELO|nr:uncharacterized protein EAE97_006292 [Botrytis byssoidea]KAF7942838.1 hypothetical protein EAE97_006292 [Botrytis byssoidea]
MRGYSFVEKAAIMAGLASSVDAFWRMPCLSRTGLARVDPLVNPGVSSPHAHVIHGSSGFGESSGYDDLMAGNCTSCQVSQDKSVYWTPALYFRDDATGQYQLVEQVGGMLAYYLLYGENVTAFPRDFAMIAGNTDVRNFSDYAVPDVDKSSWASTSPYNTQDFLRQAAVGFNCLNYPKNEPEGTLYRHFMPDKAYMDSNCLNGTRIELMFPSCWNETAGVTAPDGKSHMAYPDQVMTGNCPAGFDTRLVSILFETIWDTYAFKGIDGEFMLANGDPTGYGYHGDFIMGWDEEFLQEAVATCTNPSGRIEDCAIFDIQDKSVYGSCNFTLPTALVDDDVVGPMSTLPGNCPVHSGPAPATAMTGAATTAKTSSAAYGTSPAKGSSAATTTSSSAIVPTLSHSAGSTIVASLGQTYVPGGVFAAVESGVAYSDSSSSTAAADATAAVSSSATTLLTTSSASLYSTSYSTTTAISPLNEKVEVDEVVWVQEDVTITVTATATTTATASGVARRRHLHEHQHAKKRGGHFA